MRKGNQVDLAPSDHGMIVFFSRGGAFVRFEVGSMQSEPMSVEDGLAIERISGYR